MSDGDRRDPVLLFIVGPPAVGKMAVGHEVSLRTGLRLLHNHLAIEPILRFFEFGSDAFTRLVGNFRRAIVEEVAKSELPGLIFTAVWAFDLPEEYESMASYAKPFADRGYRVLYVELEADQDERLRRNATEFRLNEKPSKRDLAESRQRLLELDAKYKLNSTGELDDIADYLRIDNSDLTAAEVADRIIERFGLPRVT